MAKRADPSDEVTEQRRELTARLKLAFIAGAEQNCRRRMGRGLTDEEFRRMLRKYPGDLTKQ